MNPRTEMIFIREVALQSQIALRAADRLPKETSGLDKLEVWVSIQSILVATANISKILLPQSKDHKSRGDHLRKILAIDDDNVLLDRRFRNHFEHYDERIESWFDPPKSAVYTDLVIDPFMSSRKFFPQFYHRGYNPVDRTVTFRGQHINLNAAILALEELLEKCEPCNQI